MMMERKSDSDWANMLDDILIIIADKLQCLHDPLRKGSLQDRIRMGAVCRRWHVSLKDEKFTFPRFPVCLMTAEKTKSYKRCLYDTSEEIFIELELPEIHGRKCWGSPFGWLVTYGLDGEIQLFNPLSRTSLPLPPQHTFTHRREWRGRTARDLRDYFMTKLILCSNPASPDCIVMAIYSEYDLLAFAKPGDEAWTLIPGTRPKTFYDYVDHIPSHPGLGPVEDVIYFNGNFFAVRQDGDVFICEDLDGPNPRAVCFASRPAKFKGYNRTYLFELAGNLSIASHSPFAVQEPRRGKYVDLQFEIFKLDLHTRNWEKIYSLGDRSLFLGDCYSFSVKAAEYKGCKANCIYFGDDSYSTRCTNGSDFGIFNCLFLDDYEYKPDPFFQTKNLQDGEDFQSSFSPPFWLIPYPC